MHTSEPTDEIHFLERPGKFIHHFLDGKGIVTDGRDSARDIAPEIHRWISPASLNQRTVWDSARDVADAEDVLLPFMDDNR
jgi:hypothetical protein